MGGGCCCVEPLALRGGGRTPSDAGLPVVSLVRYLAIASPQMQAGVRDVVARSMRFELAVTSQVPNPFGYAWQLVQYGTGRRYSGFFFPHNVTPRSQDQWWQGENARLGSLATAARLAARAVGDDALTSALRTYSADQLNWIVGVNPFNVSMMDGVGREAPMYLEYPDSPPTGSWRWLRSAGGIVNGITGTCDVVPLRGEHRQRMSFTLSVMAQQVVTVTATPRPTAVIAATTTWFEYPQLWRKLMDQVHANVRWGDPERAGRDVMLYHDAVPNIEIGVELDQPAEIAAPVVRSALPAGEVAMTVHYGPLELLGDAHDTIIDWCEEHGRRRAGPRWEIYGHWATDPELLETEVYYLLD